MFAVSPFAAIRSAPVRTQSTSPVAMSDAAAPSTMTAERDAERLELPCREAGSLQQRPRLVHPHVLDEALFPRRTNGSERRSVAARREASRVAVREYAGAVSRRARRRGAPSAGTAPPLPRGAPARARASDRRASRRAPRGGSRLSAGRTRAPRTPRRDPLRVRPPARTRTPPRHRSLARRESPSSGSRRRPRPPTRSAARPPRRADAAGRGGRPRPPRAARSAVGSGLAFRHLYVLVWECKT